MCGWRAGSRVGQAGEAGCCGAGNIRCACSRMMSLVGGGRRSGDWVDRVAGLTGVPSRAGPPRRKDPDCDQAASQYLGLTNRRMRARLSGGVGRGPGDPVPRPIRKSCRGFSGPFGWMARSQCCLSGAYLRAKGVSFDSHDLSLGHVIGDLATRSAPDALRRWP